MRQLERQRVDPHRRKETLEFLLGTALLQVEHEAYQVDGMADHARARTLYQKGGSDR